MKRNTIWKSTGAAMMIAATLLGAVPQRTLAQGIDLTAARKAATTVAQESCFIVLTGTGARGGIVTFSGPNGTAIRNIPAAITRDDCAVYVFLAARDAGLNPVIRKAGPDKEGVIIQMAPGKTDSSAWGFQWLVSTKS